MHGLLEMDLPSCCAGYVPDSAIAPVYAEDPENSHDWVPVVDVLGRPCTAGDVDDAYYAGENAPDETRPPPENYVYRHPDPHVAVEVDLEREFPDLKRVRFRLFDSGADGRLTPQGQRNVQAWLRSLYGTQSKIDVLGEGGYSVAYRVCASKNNCVVAKVRKIPPSSTPGQLLAHLDTAVTDLRRDLGIYVIARQLVARAVLMDDQGGRHQFVRLARFSQPKRFKVGIIEQELIARPATDHLKAALKKVRADTTARARVLEAVRLSHAASPDTSPTAEDVDRFLDRFYKSSRFGPDVIKVAAWVRACERLSSVAEVAEICSVARQEFHIPDDFEDRLAALEQMYRDTAAEVIRFSRANFVEATGNHCRDGLVREVGRDYNHGRNVGWEAASGQFVLFDF